MTPITSALGRADDADPLRGRVSASGKRGVNALGEGGRIGVAAGADDDSGMSGGYFDWEGEVRREVANIER